MMRDKKIRSVNWHITAKCNYKCKFCYVQKLDNEIMNISEAFSVLRKLRDAKTEKVDIEKINFVGGEPLLHPLFFNLLKQAYNYGFITSIVTNGSLINEQNIGKIAEYTDWIGLSVDSMSNIKEAELGRGTGNHVNHAIRVSDLIHEYGLKLKLNTTVTKLTYLENMQELVFRMNPHRWKVFQMLHIKGQNDRCVEELSITDNEFKNFVKRHEHVHLIGRSKPVFESNEDMKGSYLILSPSGKVIDNSSGLYNLFNLEDFIQSPDKFMDVDKYLKRDGVYW